MLTELDAASRCVVRFPGNRTSGAQNAVLKPGITRHFHVENRKTDTTACVWRDFK